MTGTKKYLNDTREALIDAEIGSKKEDAEYSPAQVEKNGPETKNGISTNLVKLRKDPSFESEVIEILGKGEKIKTIGKVKGFNKVCTESGHIGYISSKFIKEG